MNIMKNIFENVYFGKAYKTRDGRKAIYIKEELVHESLSHTDVLYAQLILETGNVFEVVKEIGVSNGTQPIYDNLDIISEWQEGINEVELDKAFNDYIVDERTKCSNDKDVCRVMSLDNVWLKEGFKYAYRKAIEK